MADTQVIEIVGRNVLVNQLLAAGLEVALPLRDRGVDLIAYAEIGDAGVFRARPIQLKASTRTSFSVCRKYERISDLLLAFVWNLEAEPVVYALTYPQSLAIADQMRWTRTSSWIDKGWYTNNEPGKRLTALLAPHAMDAAKWRALVVGSVAVDSQ